MNVINSILKYFSTPEREIYCQQCGNGLTGTGGDVSNSGNIYCHGYFGIENACGIRAIFSGKETEAVGLQFYKPKEVQKAIQKQELTQFGPLERSLQ